MRQLQIQSRRRIWDVSKDKDVHVQLPKHQQNCQVWGCYNVKRQLAYYQDRVYLTVTVRAGIFFAKEVKIDF